jgi:hypothetical protein
MTEAIFGLMGVVLGALLSGVISHWIEATRERKDAIVASRLVSQEISMIHGEVGSWIDSRYVPDNLVLKQESWDAYKQILARSLPSPDWDMVAATYTWVHLMTTDPHPGHIHDDRLSLFESIRTEVKGGILSLEPLVEEMKPRVPLRIRLQRRRKVREIQRNAYSLVIDQRPTRPRRRILDE